MPLDPCCADIIGGEIIIQINYGAAGVTGPITAGNSVKYEAMGEVRIQPARVERTAGATSGGSIWVTEATRPARAIMSFANRCTAPPLRLFQERCRMDVTIIEKSRGVMHMFTNALAVGAPELNLATGEISGIEIVASNYMIQEFYGNYEPQQIYIPGPAVQDQQGIV